MKKLCPNVDKENGLETVLEVPIPEEMFTNLGNNASSRWENMRALMKYQCDEEQSSSFNSSESSHMLSSGSNNEFMALLKLVSAPLIPLQVHAADALSRPIKDASIETSTAKYIVQQYIAATGGLATLNMVDSMYAVGEVKMSGSPMHKGDDSVDTIGKSEVGGFVVWQKNPDLWYLELVVSGFKVSAGSDGKVAWNQCSSQPSHANKGSPRPLRRFFQGLDPRSIANLFLDAVCIGEKTINNEDCFVLKLEITPDILGAQSTSQTEIVHHTIWGYFSQRMGLIVQFKDTKLVKMKSKKKSHQCVFWETSMETLIDDYRCLDGINIAHSGKTSTILHRYGGSLNHKRKFVETWTIDDIGFNICGLSMVCFLAPADLKREDGSKS